MSVEEEEKDNKDSSSTATTTTTTNPAPTSTTNTTMTKEKKVLTIRLPDDFHHHCRDGDAMADVLVHAHPRFGRCLMMPNINPPVTTTNLVMEYRDRISSAIRKKNLESGTFRPLMTLYLTDRTTPDEIRKAYSIKNDDDGTPVIVGCKYYPAGATTNSDHGVTDVQNIYPVLRVMEEIGMMLCIHSEVTHGDIFDREKIFLHEIMTPIVTNFPKLKITMEHISTKDAVEYILSAPDNVKATITCHHLAFNRNGTQHTTSL
jgi:dihydroorotase